MRLFAYLNQGLHYNIYQSTFAMASSPWTAVVCLCFLGSSQALQTKPVVTPASIRPVIRPTALPVATTVSVSPDEQLPAAVVPCVLLDSDEAQSECATTTVTTGVAIVPDYFIDPSSPESDSESSSNANTARFALALVAATYGSNYACVKLLDEWIGEPSIAALLRFTVALSVMLPALAYCGAKDDRYFKWAFAKDGLVIGAWFAAGYCAQAIALETSPAGIQAFLLALSVLVCPMLEAVVDGKEQPKRVWFAALLAATGVAALELDGIAHGGALSQGDIIGLLQPLFFGAGFFQCEKAMHRHGRGAKDLATPAALTAWQLVAVLALTSVWVVGAGGGEGLEKAAALATDLVTDPFSAGHAAILGTILWTGVGTTAGCTLVEAAALGELSSADATVVFATEPLWGAGFAFLLLGETMGPQCQLGGMLMVLACIVSSTEGEMTVPAPAEVSRATHLASTPSLPHPLVTPRPRSLAPIFVVLPVRRSPSLARAPQLPPPPTATPSATHLWCRCLTVV